LAVATVVAVVLGKVFEDKGPRLDGQEIRLRVELKAPPDWKPDNALKAGHGGCWVQKYPQNGPTAQNPFQAGDLRWEAGEPWVLACDVPLKVTATPRYILVYTSKTLEVTFAVPLPKHPKKQHLEWSSWSSEGFIPQRGRPAPPPGLAFRYRVVKDAEYTAAHPEADVAFAAKRQGMLAAMPENPTVADWLPFYENDNEVPAYSNQLNGREVEAVRAHPQELLPLLRSRDLTTQRRAVWATTFLEKVPEELLEPLTQAGLLAIPMIRAAQEGFLPGDPDELDENKAWSFYVQWGMAMDRAGVKERRAILEQMAAQLEKGPLGDTLETMAEAVKKGLEKPE
jgi:hypothetical protein